MPIFTIETSYRLPVYRHRTYEAESLEEACRRAIEDDDWSTGRLDYDSAGKTFVSGSWEGADAAYRGKTLSLPPRLMEQETFVTKVWR